MGSNLNWNSKSFGRVGVLMGGWSNERTISLKSGEAILKALQEADCEVVPIDLKDPTIACEEIERAGMDVAFIALHGHFGEDGGIQALLERLRIPYTGSSVEASRRAMNKVLFRQIVSQAGIRMPEGVVLDGVRSLHSTNRSSGLSRSYNNVECRDLTPKFPLPCVVKPSLEGSSIGISIVDSIQELPKAIEFASQYSSTVIVEKYIPGDEITVGILQDQSLPPVQIIPKNRFYDYESKYAGGTEYLVPARLSEQKKQEAQSIGLLVHQLVGCRSFSRVDMILGEDQEFYILELNTIPGLTDKSLLPKAAKAVGISFTELCLKILESAVKYV